MAKSVYDVLGVTANAPQELVDQAYQMALRRLEPLASSGNDDARNHLIAIKEAYRVVRDAERRALYDAERRERQPVDPSQPQPPDPVVMNCWNSGKTTWVVGGLLAVGVILAGRSYMVSGQEARTRAAEVAQRAKAEQARVENERLLATGVVGNQAASINYNQAARERQLRLQEAAEERRARELEYRTQQQQQRLDMQHRAQEARLERDAERERQRTKREAEREAQAAADAIEREKRYYTCMNGAISLYGADRAKLKCSR